jgi:CheY-like chemotaxis protein
MVNTLSTICYFPTTVLLIDDNRKFLKSLKLDLDSSKACYKTFDSPQSTLDFLFNEYQPNLFFNHWISKAQDEDWDHRTIDINLRAIHRECHNPKRFSEVSALIVDFAMPEMTGLELCEKLKGQPYKKVLLTCEADELIAVKAFNAGIIDKFIRKDVAKFATVINDTIAELQKKYFHNLLHTVINSLSKASDRSSGFLKDKIFIDFFESLIKQHNVCEFYLMDAEGSFMFLDIDGIPKWLVVKSEKEMSELADFAASEHADKSIVDALANRGQIPYFYTDEELQTPPHKWKKFFHSAQKLIGKETYYYALITDPTAHEVGDVLSFREFCENVK